ncbi:SAM-dependent methyltransferase [Brumimicrobium aurantiacum]|uniref:Class I SAM-dependent methyltransferase n=1 Tax=Brumimicrobium aurantiacum TaxID=1737063 RepID=A0A3E1EZC8_9FLAO|nr:class I SAM-dependent methyltransferase [Brumimicrobium aurantiacum]RFC54843.1 class I SAM-dependent methyltransferase [Brumimicrobium aurantiacum]
MSEQKGEWFETWFDTSYYHILYQNRDFTEAEKFISNLLAYLNLPKSSNCLDLACGKGRHSIFLNKQGLQVTGVDLSANSIENAKPFENDTLSFDTHDMREVYLENTYDVVFNLFTSFGYFEDYDDNQKVLDSVHQMLVEDGLLVIDFMNADYALDNLVEEEVKTLSGIDFNITKSYNGSHIFKNIDFVDKGKPFHFQEKVQAIKKEEFETLLENAGFDVLDVFGDFSLAPFDRKESDRLIIIAKKK